MCLLLNWHPHIWTCPRVNRVGCTCMPLQETVEGVPATRVEWCKSKWPTGRNHVGPQLRIMRCQHRCECSLKHWSAYARRCTADSAKAELAVVLCASKDQEVIAQSRCLRLTGMEIYIYIYIQTWYNNAKWLLASLYSSAIKLATLRPQTQGRSQSQALIHSTLTASALCSCPSKR